MLTDGIAHACVLQVEDRAAMILTFTPDSELPSRQAVCMRLAQFGSLEVCDVGMLVNGDSKSIVVKLTAQGLMNASRGMAGGVDEILGMPKVRTLLTVTTGMLPPAQRSLPNLPTTYCCAASKAGRANVQGGLRPSGSIIASGHSAVQGSFLCAVCDSSAWAILQKAGLKVPAGAVNVQEIFMATRNMCITGM